MKLSFSVLFRCLLASFISFTLIQAKQSYANALQDNAKGKEVYEHYCITCHQEGVAGAPKINDTTDWKPHLTNKTIDDLVKSAINGLNNMPAQGTCYECNNDDLKAAIQYMLPKS